MRWHTPSAIRNYPPLRHCLDLLASSLAYPSLHVGLSRLPHQHHFHTVLLLAPQIEALCVFVYERERELTNIRYSCPSAQLSSRC